MNRRNTASTFLLAAIAGFAVTTAPTRAGEISKSTTAPSVDGDDISNYAAPTGTQKWFNDIEHDAGQTFTPTADGLLQSFTIKIGATQQNPNDGGNENVDIRFGTISRPEGVFTFTDVYTENAAMAPSPDGDWMSSDYITFTFDTPQPVSAGVEYGIITDAQAMGDWHQGIPYRVTTGNTYAGGSMINRGGEITNNDLLFHIDIGSGDPALPFAITEIDYDAGTDTVVLTWRSQPGETYTVKYSSEMTDWGTDIQDSITMEEHDENPNDGNHLTVSFDLAAFDPEVAARGTLLFRVEK